MPVAFYVEHCAGDVPYTAFATNLSVHGAYFEHLLSPMARRSHVLSIELPLPGNGETLWARGEVVYERFGRLFHGTAVRFTSMAVAHRRELGAFVRSLARRELTSGVDIVRPTRGRG
jgi:hypothetical protein